MTATKKVWNTGFKPGRPRAGELRLVSPNAVKIQEWREKNREKYREYQRQYQAAWRLKNLERSKEIKRATMARAKNKLAHLALI
jgi:hypothetical protein